MPITEFETKYKMVQRLGEGGFGCVYKVKNRSTGSLYAAKVVDTPQRYTQSLRTGEVLPDEIAVLKNLRHDNIIRYVEHFRGEKHWVIVMEYLSGYEDLYEYLRRKDKNFDEAESSLHHLTNPGRCELPPTERDRPQRPKAGEHPLQQQNEKDQDH
jgi:serine/threonine protein kinase